MRDDGHHWTYSEWLENTVEKIVRMGLSAPEEHRADYLRVQIRAAFLQSLDQGRSGQATTIPLSAEG